MVLWQCVLIFLGLVHLTSATADKVPLTILPYYDDSLDELSADNKLLIQSSLIPAVQAWVSSNIKVDPNPDNGTLRIDRQCYRNGIKFQNGKRSCMMRRCNFNFRCGHHIVPDEHLDYCWTYVIPGMAGMAGSDGEAPAKSLTQGAGVSEGFILYVSAGQCNIGKMFDKESLTMGSYCRSDSDPATVALRPTYGYIKFCEDHLSNKVSSYEEQVGKTLQRILNILAFNKDLVKNFPMPATGSPITAMSRDFETASKALTQSVEYVVLPTVVKEVQAHLSCQQLPGAPLEQNDADNDMFFEKLMFNNELMSPALAKRGVVSRITWALLHDSGWYTVERDAFEVLQWGRGLGCPFALGFCYARLVNGDFDSDKVAPHCTKHNHMGCTSDHHSIGECKIYEMDADLPDNLQNFKSDVVFKSGVPAARIGGVDEWSDRCPYYTPNKLCSDVTQQPTLNLYGEHYSGESRCINFGSAWSASSMTSGMPTEHMSGCYKVTCTADSYTVSVGKVEYSCTSAKIPISHNIHSIVFNGSLECPDYDVICPASSTEGCPSDCTGNGQCVAGACACNPGYYGDACSKVFNVDFCGSGDNPCINGGQCTTHDGSFTCKCGSGYTGALCHLPSLCKESSCSNGGVCEEKKGVISCLCPEGYTGDKCQNKPKPCDVNDCLNGAKCYEDDGVNRCVCSYRYSGDKCQTATECDYVGLYSCYNGGTCLRSETGEARSCECLEGYSGSFCEIATCTTNTCNGRGTCSEMDEGYIMCACDEGFVGENCESAQTEKIEMCQMIGKCSKVDGVVTCNAGYKGVNCLESDPCALNPCGANAVICNNYKSSFECVCKAEWTGETCMVPLDVAPSVTATDMPFTTITLTSDPCEPNPCNQGATCTTEKNNFFCDCTGTQFIGKTCSDPRPKCWDYPCLHEGFCTESYVNDHGFDCECIEQWTGVRCEIEVNPCDLITCQNGAGCIINSDQIAVCECLLGFEGDYCETKANPCFAEPCLNGGTCNYFSSNNSYTCTCEATHTGFNCESELENNCILSNVCENETPCIGSMDNYTCQCPHGLEGQYCQTNPNDCRGNPCRIIMFSMCRDQIGGYKCECMNGFELKDQGCVDKNECEVEGNCVNGICLNLPGRFMCRCKAGWKGKHCDINYDECQRHMCQNNATCVDLIADYRCECQGGYKGRLCESAPEPCDTMPCQQGAPCHNINSDDYVCTCPAGFGGKNCETDKDECADNPCGDHGACEDGVNIYTCNCDVGWGGHKCTIYTGSCGDEISQCLNDADCIDLPGGDYNCKCSQFFSGKNCEINIDDCASNPCGNEGECTDGLGDYTCTCTEQWTGVNCTIDVNECEQERCLNHAQCINEDGGYHCECVAGYEGKMCETNIDDCISNGCQNGAQCIDSVLGYTCKCTTDFNGEMCEIKIERCADGSCLHDGVCSVVNNIINCDCTGTGYSGSQCGEEINECIAIECQHQAECIDKLNDFHCDCPCSFTGRYCEIEVDFCETDVCQNGMCMSLPNSCDYQCVCDNGYTGKDCEIEINECESDSCIHGNCTDMINDYSCSCFDGYGGRDCEQVWNQCLAFPCKNSGNCTALSGTDDVLDFECSCTAGWQGKTCEDQLPACTISPCGDYGACHPAANNTELCVCDKGFEGDFCMININECLDNPCLNNGQCVDGIAKYSCNCAPGFGGDSCEILTDPCEAVLCRNGGKCHECSDDENCDDRYYCECSGGFEGNLCEINIDDCVVNNCQNGGFCIDNTGGVGFSCFCNAGFEGDLCEIDFDDCAASPCVYGNNCTDLIADYTCTCDGFQGKNCEKDIDECLANPCMNEGTCENTFGSFECICAEGYGGQRCERVIAPCDAYPCLNLAECSNVDRLDYSCECIGGWTGRNCEIPSDACKDVTCSDHGICHDYEGVAECQCDIAFKGEHCEVILCMPGLCANEGECINTPAGFECVCPLPYAGKYCAEMLYVMKYTKRSAGYIPMEDLPEDSLKYDFDLKIADTEANQIILSQETDFGLVSVGIKDNRIRLLKGGEEELLSAEIPKDYVSVSVDLNPLFFELKVDDVSAVMLHEDEKNVAPAAMLYLGMKDDLDIPSYTGGLISFRVNGELKQDLAVGQGFEELQDDYSECKIGLDFGVDIPESNKCNKYPGWNDHPVITDNCANSDCPVDCRETNQGPECICSWPYGGETCTDLAVIPSFRADSMLTLSDKDMLKGENLHYEAMIEIKPKYPRGFIALHLSKDKKSMIAVTLDTKYGQHDTLTPIIRMDIVTPTKFKRMENPQPVELDEWTLLKITVHDKWATLQVGNSSVSDRFPHANLDGDIILGHVPEDMRYEGDAPGFFGEINPLILGKKKVNIIESAGVNMLAARSRPDSELFQDVCDLKPCGDDGCVMRAEGYLCLCTMSSGDDCSAAPKLLTLYGGNSSYIATTFKPKDENEIKLRIFPYAPDGVLLYGANKFGNALSKVMFYLYLIQGKLHAGTTGVSNDCLTLPDTVKTHQWSDITMTLSKTELSLQLDRNPVKRLKFKDEYKIPSDKERIFVGGVRNFAGLDSIPALQNISGFPAARGFAGQISKLDLSGKSQMDKIIQVMNAHPGGGSPRCAQNPCGNDICTEMNQNKVDYNPASFNNTENYSISTCTCLYPNLGTYCDKTVEYYPLRVDKDGWVKYEGGLDVGDEIQFEVRSDTLNGVVFRIPAYYNSNNQPGFFLEIKDGKLFAWNDEDLNFTMVSNETAEIKLRRTEDTMVINFDGANIRIPFPSTTLLDNIFYIASNTFEGQIFSSTRNKKITKPVLADKVSQGTVPDCHVNPCLNNAQCLEDPQECVCLPGYAGKFCESLIDQCAVETRCAETERCYSVDGTSWYCETCRKGYRGDTCEEKAFCDILEPCTSDNVSGTCMETEQSYYCDCGDGEKRSTCETTQACLDVECQHNGTCVELGKGGFECACNPAFSGQYCEVMVDNCLNNTQCSDNAVCISTFDNRRFFCLCDVGWTGDICDVEVDPCSQNPCLNEGLCTSDNNTFSCQCSDPFYGIVCNQTQSPCLNNDCLYGKCSALDATSYKCNCEAGYEGEYCQLNIDECMDELSCNGQGECTDTEGGFTCECHPGFNGTVCDININECEPNPCNGNGLCIDGWNEYYCVCDAMFEGDNCETAVDMCATSPCENNATCYNYGIDYFCICEGGYEGVNCSVNTDDCANNRCENGALCVDGINNYTCSCNKGFNGEYCEENVNECTDKPCYNGGLCTDLPGGFNCTCPEYYQGDHCETPLGECWDLPCQNEGICHEIGGIGDGYVCQCKEGFKGVTCSEKIMKCTNNPCLNEAKCLVSDAGHYCSCSYPYTGPICADLVTVPYLATDTAYMTYENVDLNLTLRIRPTHPGHVLTASNLKASTTLELRLSDSYELSAELVMTGLVGIEMPLGSLMREAESGDKNLEWSEISIQVTPSKLILSLNGVEVSRKIKSGEALSLSNMWSVRIGRSVSPRKTGPNFYGCIYDVYSVLAAPKGDAITQCRHGNTCVPEMTGPCGVSGECESDSEGTNVCVCPMGYNGAYCQQEMKTASPMFSGSNSFVRLTTTSTRAWTVDVTVSGYGNVLSVLNKQGEVAGVVSISKTKLKVHTSNAKESATVPNLLWHKLRIRLVSGALSVTAMDSGEMLQVSMPQNVDQLYLGGAPDDEGGFKGCMTSVQVDYKDAVYVNTVQDSSNVHECTMSACADDPCMNNVYTSRPSAQCVSDGPHNFSCLCGANFTGPLCDTKWQDQVPKFSGNSFIKFTRPDFAELTVKIVFKASHKQGLLLTTEHDDSSIDYLSIGLNRGRVHLGYDLGSGPALLKCPVRVDDGKWHFVHIQLRGRHAILMVDKWVSETVSPGLNSVLNVAHHYYIGGSPTKNIFSTGLYGCVESVTISHQPMAMTQSQGNLNIGTCQDNLPASSIYNFRHRL